MIWTSPCGPILQLVPTAQAGKLRLREQGPRLIDTGSCSETQAGLELVTTLLSAGVMTGLDKHQLWPLTTSSTVAGAPERRRSVSFPLLTLASIGHLLPLLLWPIISEGDQAGTDVLLYVDRFSHWFSLFVFLVILFSFVYLFCLLACFIETDFLM